MLETAAVADNAPALELEINLSKQGRWQISAPFGKKDGNKRD